MDVKVGDGGDNERRGHDACQHGEGVLETENETEQHGHLAVEREEGLVDFLLLDEGNVWCEERSVVVIAHETLLGGELLEGAQRARLDSLAKGLCWRSAGQINDFGHGLLCVCVCFFSL